MKNPEEKSYDDVLERALDKGATLPAELSGIHVLIVDDDPVALEMMESALYYVGALVTSVPSAKRALEVLSRVSPDVIVSDMRMPEKDGVTLARELQAAGIMGFLRKPITFTELVHAVAALAFVGGAG